MGLGPVEATRELLNRPRMKMEEFGLIELNEAFAAQALSCIMETPEFEIATVNPNGGAIAIGHPFGCSGARLVAILVHEVKRARTRFGIVTLCIGVGQGISAAFELAS